MILSTFLVILTSSQSINSKVSPVKKAKSCKRYTNKKPGTFKLSGIDYACQISTEDDCTCTIHKDSYVTYPENVEFPETLISENEEYRITIIGGFAKCESIKTVSFPKTIINILSGAFEGVPLTSIKWGGSEEIMYDPFPDAKIDVVTLPKTLKLVTLYYSFQYSSVLIIPKEVEKVDGIMYFPVDRKVFFYAKLWFNPQIKASTNAKAYIYYFQPAVLSNENQPSTVDYVIYTTLDYQGTMALKKEAQKVLTKDFRFYKSSTGGIALAEAFKAKEMSFEIPSNLPEIPDLVVDELGPELLKDWTDLMEITIPKSIKTINTSVFSGCNNLYSIKFDDKSELTAIMDEAFSGTELTDFSFGDSIRSIGSRIFKSCKSLKSISLPATMTSISANAFDDCTSITTFTIRATDTIIKSFKGCTSLRGTLIISEGIAKIESQCFAQTSIEELKLPGSLTSISSSSFYQCASLSGVLKFPSSISDIKENAFSGCFKLTEVHYCGATPITTERAFGSTHSVSKMYVNKKYEGDCFCGIKVTKVLNDKCELEQEDPSSSSEEVVPDTSSEGKIEIPSSSSSAEVESTYFSPSSDEESEDENQNESKTEKTNDEVNLNVNTSHKITISVSVTVVVVLVLAIVLIVLWKTGVLSKCSNGSSSFSISSVNNVHVNCCTCA